MKFFSIALKDLKEIIRDRKGLIFILLFPVIIMMISGLFLNTEQGSHPHDLSIVNYDQGSILDNGDSVNYGDSLSQNLMDSKYQDSNTHLFNVAITNESNANNLLAEGKVDAELIIPQNYSDAMVTMINNDKNTTVASSSVNTSNITTTLVIRGDTQSNDFEISQTILIGLINTYQDNLITQAPNDSQGIFLAAPSGYVDSTIESVDVHNNDFDFLIPGVIIFSLLLLALIVAINLTREEENGGLSRIKLSKIRGIDLLVGGFIPWMLVVLIQLSLLIVAIMIIGWQINLSYILLVLLIGLIGGVASISLGIIIASFTSNYKQAISLGIILIIPIGFMTIVQLPQNVFKIVKYHFQIFDFLPWTHVFNVLQTTLIFGEGWNFVSHEVLLAVILTVILFIISIMLYSRNKINNKNMNKLH